MADDELTKKYAGMNILIRTVDGLHQGAKKKYEGILVSITPKEHVVFKDNSTGLEKKLEFAGRFEGIMKIFGGAETYRYDKCIYYNPMVIDKYSGWGYIEDSPYAEPEARQNIAKHGIFS